MLTKLSNKHIIGFILFIAVVLRFYHFFEIPFTHDEFSAFFRTQFNGFNELIEKGVKVDGHPAGIQVFLFYWIRWFGSEPWVVKLPFTLMGVFSVFLVYSVAKNWFNETVGLLTAAMLASTQYMVMYSQIARPYISGLFFSLAMIYYWTHLVKNPDKKFILNAAGYILFSAFCAYNHHFSLLFTAIAGITGLFLIEKGFRKKFFLAGVLIFLLYIPHFPIFFHQLKMGGVEGWLGKPQPVFVKNYMFYLFNYSIFTLIFTILVTLWGVIYGNKNKQNIRFSLIAFIWFILPFAIGYFYSVYVNSVLQFSVLIFSHAFLYLFVWSMIKPQKPVINLLLVISIVTMNIFSLIYQRKHYQLFYHSPFKEVLLDYQKLGNIQNQTLSIIDTDPENKHYYLNKLPIDSSFIAFDKIENELDLIALLQQNCSQMKYLYFGCQSNNPAITVPIIQQFYPTMVWQKNYAGGTSYLFSKEGTKVPSHLAFHDFETKQAPFFSELNEKFLTDTLRFSGKHSYVMNSTQEWSVVFSAPLQSVINHENNFIDISIRVFVTQPFTDAILAASIESGGKTIHWNGTSFNKFITPDKDSTWIMIHHSIKLSDAKLVNRSMQLKAYVWNLKHQNFIIDDFSVSVRTGNPYIYGLLEDF